MNGISLESFHDELEKIAARAGLKRIKRLVRTGSFEDLELANKMAKTPGVLRPARKHPDMKTTMLKGPEGQNLWKEREFLGSEIKRFKRGGEHDVALVADPEHGVAIRKIRHSGAASPEKVYGDPTKPYSMPALVEQLGNAPEMAPYVAKTYERARHPVSGRRFSFHEYVPEHLMDEAAQSAAASKAKRRLKWHAEDAKTEIGDLDDWAQSGGNFIYTKDPVTGKPTAKIVDFTAAKPDWPTALEGKDPGEPIGDLFRRISKPPMEDVHRYEGEIAAAAKEVKPILRGRKRLEAAKPPPIF